MASIIFVLPGLVIVGWWNGFPFWESFLVCASGGTLGVLFTIPLRRALVTNSDLPYPEGIAAAEVLKVGSGLHEGGATAGAAREGLFAIVLGSVASAGLAVFAATRIAAGEVQSFFRIGADGATGYNLAFSLALLGAGHLVGITVGLAMFLGLLIAWAAALPILTALQPDPSAGSPCDACLDDAGAFHRGGRHGGGRDLDTRPSGASAGERLRTHHRRFALRR
jgi:putative OPT family oligopeptide transporter